MSRVKSTSLLRVAAVLAWVAAAVAALGPGLCRGHEDHAPLPSKGVTVAGNNVLLSDKARKAIGLTTAKVAFGDLHRTVEVNARVELPWKQQAMITSLVPGKIDEVLVRPGETVAAGQELAWVVSMELEAIQLAMLQAKPRRDHADAIHGDLESYRAGTAERDLDPRVALQRAGRQRR